MNLRNSYQISDIPNLDYSSIRQEGLRQLEHLAGSEWTDFNEHDPGITILEQYCYALTELIYRCNFPLPDLLSRDGKDPYRSLFSPAQILTSRPVTLIDLRKLAIDVRGVKNAWIEKIDPSSLNIFYNRSHIFPFLNQQKNLIQLQGDIASESVNLKGLYQVLIESSPVLEVNSAEIISNVTARLHAHRPLSIDFGSVKVLDSQKIQVQATIEIRADGNPEDILVAILSHIAAQISPTVSFYTLAQQLAAGKQIDEIFDGPMLTQGFIDTDELTRMERKTGLRVSDFIGAIMDIPGVLMVKHLALSSEGHAWENWWLNLADDKTPVFDLDHSTIKLERQQLAVNIDDRSVRTRYQQAQTSLAYRPAKPEELNITPPVGRDRRVGRYYSAQHQFPAVYGLGETGLPPEASEQRRAQLKQLQAYLLFFDQLLANQFAQLAHIGELLGFDEDNAQTYFATSLDAPNLGVDAIWRQQDTEARCRRLDQMIENPETAVDDSAPQINWPRKNRFLDHLLARFAEQFTDYARYQQDLPVTPTQRQEGLARDKQAWLRGYCQISAGRGTGCNVLLSSTSDLEQRLRLKLGLSRDQPFYLIEHILLRPLDMDLGQRELPLLADACCPDPYSLQISLVFYEASFPKESNFRRFIEQTVREEVPAHLVVYLRWLNQHDIEAFDLAYKAWVESHRTLRLESEVKTHLGYRLRDARDRIIDWLAIGHTYPLADLPVRYTQTVAWGQFGRITLMASQPGVRYQLLGKADDALDSPVEAYGDGSDLVLLTPAITNDIGFKVTATKPNSQLTVTLFQDIDIKVGLDSSLQAEILDADLLDPSTNNPGSNEPRLVSYGAQPRIEIHNSQAGVDYRLVRIQADLVSADTVLQPDGANPQPIGLKHLSDAVVRGDSHTITVQARPALEDTDIRILAIKEFDPNDQQQTQFALLDIVLPLKVRANPALAVTVALPLLDYRAGTTVIIERSQASARYQIQGRPIRDSEFIRTDAEPSALPVEGLATLQVKNPPNPTPDTVALGEAKTGNGAALALPIDGLKEDTLIVVQAIKVHETQDGKPKIPSDLQLNQAAAILVRPGTDLDFPLRLKAKAEGEPVIDGLRKEATYLVLNGQPGVFYHFHLVSSSDDLGLPVYFHKVGKGVKGNKLEDIEGLQIEVDFTIIGNSSTSPPEWDCPVDLDSAAKLVARAVKAQTGLEAVFEITVAALLAVT